MKNDIRLIKKIAHSKRNWKLTEVDLLYNIYRLNKFGMQSDKPLEIGDIVVFINNRFNTGYYKILGVRPHGGEKSYELQSLLQGEDEEVETLNGYVSEIQRVDPKKQEELETKAKALETKAQKAPEKQSASSYQDRVNSELLSRQLF